MHRGRHLADAVTIAAQLWKRNMALKIANSRCSRLHTALLVLWVVATSIGCSDDPPSQPTTPTPTVESVSISGARDLAEGETLILTVSIRWSSGTTETVSDGVTWTTEDSSVATVTNRGGVTAHTPGEARIRAMFNNVTGATTVKVLPAARVTIGRVHESRPTEHIGMPGARVTVVSSDGTTETAVTDGAGNFSVRLKPGAVQMTVTASGYDALATEVLVTPGAPLSLAVVPTAREVRISWPYIFPPPSPPIRQRTFRIDVHHAGELRPRTRQARRVRPLTGTRVSKSATRTIASWQARRGSTTPWPAR